MRIRAYISVSKQFRHLVDDAVDYIASMLYPHYDKVSMNKFKGGTYQGCETEIGSPDVMFVVVKKSECKIGRGCYEEIKYAIRNDIPVCIINKSNDLFYLSKRVFHQLNDSNFTPDSDDYRNHVTLPCKWFQTQAFLKSMLEYEGLDIVACNKNEKMIDVSGARLKLDDENYTPEEDVVFVDSVHQKNDELLLLL